jgi:glycyl-tRNA synthetase
MKSSETSVSLETLVSLCKRRGFVYPAADIYGGINGVYDFGPLGTLLKKNIRKAWLASLENDRGPIVELEGSLLAPEAVWKASGHVEGFHDPMIDCKNCKHRFRADDTDFSKGCPSCGKNEFTDIRNFNMMFKTQLGALESAAATCYLRPETAQAIFVNFKNVLTTARVKMPFGIAQVGKAFRNEITPKQFLFRMREFEQMEIEWFCKPETSNDALTFWIEHRLAFYKTIGITPEKIRIREHEKHELAHYAARCVDVEYNFPFGWKELEGIAHRGAFDLTQHTTHSGKDLAVFDEETRESYMPHVVESSIGVDRLFLTLLFDSYREDEIEGEKRIVLAFAPSLAPITVAFMPLAKKLSEPVEKLYKAAKLAGLTAQIDESGSIGKRYRRQDEIGTPFCVTYDFDSEQDHCVTVRDRDTTKQERIPAERLLDYLKDQMKKERKPRD